jgi:hypothetical protein
MPLSRAMPDDSGDDHRILPSLRAGDKIRFLPLLRQNEINDIITSIRIDNDGKLVIFTYRGETVYNVFAMAGSKWYHSIMSPLTIAAAELGALPIDVVQSMKDVETLAFKKKQEASVKQAWIDSANDSDSTPEPEETEAQAEKRKKSENIIAEARALMAEETDEDIRERYQIYQARKLLKAPPAFLLPFVS